MAMLAIGGSGRGVGKTAVGCALIAALPELRWTAVKISPHEHGLPAVWEETDRSSAKDSGRYLAAGAERAFLVRGDAEAELAGLAGTGALLVESNRRLSGALFLAVLAGHEASWKPSMRDRVAEADALVLMGGMTVAELPEALRGKPVFDLAAGEWLTPRLLRFVGERLHPRPWRR